MTYDNSREKKTQLNLSLQPILRFLFIFDEYLCQIWAVIKKENGRSGPYFMAPSGALAFDLGRHF